MYAGSSNFNRVSTWLEGYEFRVREAGEPNDLDGFQEWLLLKFRDAPSNVGWLGIIGHQFGDREATQKLFECLDQFLDERENTGLEAIVREHAAFEMQRYGFLSISRLRHQMPSVRASDFIQSRDANREAR
jgi:hypothetical protein